MPLADELVLAKKPSPPEYTHDKEQKCDWSIIFKKPPEDDFSFSTPRQLSPIEQFRDLKQSTESVLDETQMLAIEDFLAYKVSLIQVNYRECSDNPLASTNFVENHGMVVIQV